MEFYYRIVVDFSHSASPDELVKLFEAVSDAIMDVLDPHIDDDSKCERDVVILGADVTHEYLAQNEIDLDRFVKDLGDTSVMDRFLDEEE